MIIFYDNQTGQVLGTVDGFATYRKKDLDDASWFLETVNQVAGGKDGTEITMRYLAKEIGKAEKEAERLAYLARDQKSIKEYIEWRGKLNMHFSHIPDSRVSKIEIDVGHPMEGLVREFEDARNPKNVLDFAVGKDEKGKRHFVDKKDIKNGKIDAKAKQKFALD